MALKVRMPSILLVKPKCVRVELSRIFLWVSTATGGWTRTRTGLSARALPSLQFRHLYNLANVLSSSSRLHFFPTLFVLLADLVLAGSPQKKKWTTRQKNVSSMSPDWGKWGQFSPILNPVLIEWPTSSFLSVSISPLWEMVQEGVDLKSIQWAQH